MHSPSDCVCGPPSSSMPSPPQSVASLASVVPCLCVRVSCGGAVDCGKSPQALCECNDVGGRPQGDARRAIHSEDGISSFPPLHATSLDPRLSAQGLPIAAFSIPLSAAAHDEALRLCGAAEGLSRLLHTEGPRGCSSSLLLCPDCAMCTASPTLPLSSCARSVDACRCACPPRGGWPPLRRYSPRACPRALTRRRCSRSAPLAHFAASLRRLLSPVLHPILATWMRICERACANMTPTLMQPRTHSVRSSRAHDYSRLSYSSACCRHCSGNCGMGSARALCPLATRRCSHARCCPDHRLAIRRGRGRQGQGRADRTPRRANGNRARGRSGIGAGVGRPMTLGGIALVVRWCTARSQVRRNPLAHPRASQAARASQWPFLQFGLLPALLPPSHCQYPLCSTISSPFSDAPSGYARFP